jgi:hypothetical protein
MSLRTIQILEGVFAVCMVVGLSVHSVPHWAGWFSGFLFLGLDTWRCMKVGEISTGPDYKWYGFKFNRDDSPELFYCVAAFKVFLTLMFLLIFLCSL